MLSVEYVKKQVFTKFNICVDLNEFFLLFFLPTSNLKNTIRMKPTTKKTTVPRKLKKMGGNNILKYFSRHTNENMLMFSLGDIEMEIDITSSNK